MPDRPIHELIDDYWRATRREQRRSTVQTGNCRSCKAPILWVKSAASRQIMILDAEPVEGGNIAIVENEAHVYKGDLFDKELPPGPRYIDHHATCPDAQKWRKNK